MNEPIHIGDSITIYPGDCRDVLPTLPDASVHCCVTSPPYWNLRDYGVDGQIGLERTSEEYVEVLVSVFREVHRVLRDDGTLWLNLGDSYAQAGGPGWQGKNGQRADRRFTAVRDTVGMREIGRKPAPGLKAKDLVGLPWMVAFALRDDGWYLRSDIIWSKKSPMPESVRDRPTSAHEHVFLLSKGPRYYYDKDAVKEDALSSSVSRMAAGYLGNNPEKDAQSHHGDGYMRGEGYKLETRNLRNVWHLGPEPYPAAHFAVFPREIPRRAIAAGCPEGGVVLDPFSGSNTTLLVAAELGRKAIGVELNPDYTGHRREALEAVTAQSRLFA